MPQDPTPPLTAPASADPSPASGPPSDALASAPSGARWRWVTVACGIALVVGAAFFDHVDGWAREVLGLPVAEVAPEAVAPTPAPALAPAPAFTFENHPMHPDRLHQPYFGLPLGNVPRALPSAGLLPGFRQLLGTYAQRQGEDDNFTVRVLDNRTGETLEAYVLEAQRSAYQATGRADWMRIDQMRREATRELVKKYRQAGIPNQYISVKWGRRNQVLEARERDAPFIEYEARLASYLGLSLLVTEIGTVETFNQDQLVSSVGARSRYQMMPYILRQRGIEHYDLPTAYGSRVDVYEEWHPLLTMEAAFTLLRGYVNAVGHEIPGISSYHTGPGNMFKLYQLYLTEGVDALTAGSSVVDAFMWALTDGYDLVSDKTSFKTYSRGYVPSGYGALLATDDIPVDTNRTFRGELVRMQPGKRLYLNAILDVLADYPGALDWGPYSTTESLYERFRLMNPHFVLPPATDQSGVVPPKGDVLLTRTSGDDIPVRFFLPLGASDLLSGTGAADVLDADLTFRFDDGTYDLDDPSVITLWDRQYAALVEDVAAFGFTRANRQKLLTLEDRFRQLAQTQPSHYRKAQLDVIRTHRQLWSYTGWDRLAETATAARGTYRMPVRPPSPLSPALLSELTPRSTP